jgi:hypothetical protein
MFVEILYENDNVGGYVNAANAMEIRCAAANSRQWLLLLDGLLKYWKHHVAGQILRKMEMKWNVVAGPE